MKKSVPALLGVSGVFFSFPLLSPAVGIVLYPFLLQGLLWGLGHRFKPREVLPFASLAAVLVFAAQADLIGVLRLASFCLGLLFLHEMGRRPRALALLMKLGAIHAGIVIGQWLLVAAGIELDFSAIFRAVYGPLLPPTGVHIDYNAFSQFGFVTARVAGLNREPAYASILFLGLGFLAARTGRQKHVLLFALAVLCTLSKIIFPLLLALILSWQRKPRNTPMTPLRTLTNLLVMVGTHLLMIVAVYENLELVETGMALDASFYHRFIGLHTLATQFDELPWFGNGIDIVSRASIFADYEFLLDRRAFLDGSTISKLMIDFGLLALVAYAIVSARLCVNWRCVLGVAIGGLFVNMLSVAPATILLFWLLTGQYAKAIEWLPRHSSRRVRGRLKWREFQEKESGPSAISGHVANSRVMAVGSSRQYPGDQGFSPLS